MFWTFVNIFPLIVRFVKVKYFRITFRRCKRLIRSKILDGMS